MFPGPAGLMHSEPSAERGPCIVPPQKRSVVGVGVSPVDYKTAVSFVMCAARQSRGVSVAAVSVHGVMTALLDPVHRFRLNSFDLAVPDGQPVRWALNWLYRASLKQRVYGPQLTLELCRAAEKEDVPVYFYGSNPPVITALERSLRAKFPRLAIAGMEAGKYRRLTPDEKCDLIARVHASGARMIFVGLGCPRQEVFAYEYREALSMPVLAVGAAFDFIAGCLPQAPAWMQNAGLEWLYRLGREPRRLWRRYLFSNPAYLFFLGMQALRIFTPDSPGTPPDKELLYG